MPRSQRRAVAEDLLLLLLGELAELLSENVQPEPLLAGHREHLADIRVLAGDGMELVGHEEKRFVIAAVLSPSLGTSTPSYSNRYG